MAARVTRLDQAIEEAIQLAPPSDAHTSATNHREALCALGARAAGADGGRCEANLGARPDCAPRNEGDARATPKARQCQLTENKGERMPERVGFESAGCWEIKESRKR
jgi:hypothetical protein